MIKQIMKIAATMMILLSIVTTSISTTYATVSKDIKVTVSELSEKYKLTLHTKNRTATYEQCLNTTKNCVIPSIYKYKTNGKIYTYRITKINKTAFVGPTKNKTKNIEKITMSSYVNTIESGTFQGLSKLKIVKVNKTANLYYIKEKAFKDCKALITFTLPNKIKGIYESAFENCVNLRNVNFPKTLKYIGKQAYSNCKKIKNVTIPKEVQYIHSGTFEGCVNLSKVEFEKNSKIKQIRESSFAYTNISTITIPKQVTTLSYSFYGCEKLKTVNAKFSSVKNIFSAFNGCNNLERLYLPKTIEKVNIRNSKNYNENEFNDNFVTYIYKNNSSIINQLRNQKIKYRYY